MEIQRSTQDGCVVVAFTGSIDLFSVAQIQQALLKDLSDQPFALVCDLAGVDTLDPVCATVFSTVANHPASRWPDTSFLLCGAQPLVAEILGRLQVPHFLRLYADVDEAIAMCRKYAEILGGTLEIDVREVEEAVSQSQ